MHELVESFVEILVPDNKLSINLHNLKNKSFAQTVEFGYVHQIMRTGQYLIC